MDKNRKILIVLCISVVLNVALFAAISFRPAPPVPAAKTVFFSVGRGQLESIMRMIPEPRRSTMRKAMAQDFITLEALHRQALKQYSGLLDQLDNVQLDATQMNTQLAAVRAAQQQLDTQAEKMLGSLILTLSPEERMLVSDILYHGRRTQ